MPVVVGVRLRRNCRIYDFDAGELELSRGDWVIVETSRGRDMGQLVTPPRDVSAEEAPHELKPIIRKANASDFRRRERYHMREQDALEKARQKVEEIGLPMRLVTAEYSYSGRALTIYFTAEKRVDFRQLVKELAQLFRARIELRQIGARDEARLLGGIGPCGRVLCCATFLCDFQRISVRMAKEQDLPLSPMKISGVCGRLLCCLNYEYEQYREIKADLPKVGEEVATLHGRGRVVGIHVPKEAVTVELRPGLVTEATAAELARAAQLEEEGQLEKARPAYVPLPQTLDKLTEGAAVSAAEEPPKSPRKRRRRKKPSAPAAQEPAARPPQPPKQRRRQRRPSDQSKAKAEPAKKEQPSAAPSSSRRRRRRRPRSSGGGSQN